MSLAPDKSCITIEAVTEGEIPNSIRVPLLEAAIILTHLKGSEEELETIP